MKANESCLIYINREPQWKNQDFSKSLFGRCVWTSWTLGPSSICDFSSKSQIQRDNRILMISEEK